MGADDQIRGQVQWRLLELEREVAELRQLLEEAIQKLEGVNVGKQT